MPCSAATWHAEHVADTAIVRRRKTYTALGTGAVLAAAVTYTGIVDPHVRGSVFPPCPFKLATGWNCPGCGGLRMIHDLLHANLSAAVVDNVFLLLGIPALVAWVLLRRRAGKPAMTTTSVAVILVASIAWTVVRNLPGFPLVPMLYGG